MQGIQLYPKKSIVPNAEFMQKFREEINRVKNLAGSTHGHKGQWTIDACARRVYQEDVLNP